MAQLAFARACLAFLVAANTVNAAQYYRPANCTQPCDSRHTCVSNICFEAWDACPEDEWVVTTRTEQLPDTDKCFDNGCSNAACPAGTLTTETRSCNNVNPRQLCLFCVQETCCPARSRVTCCSRLNCTAEYADCRVPQQLSLGLGGSSKSNIKYTNLADGGTSQFPFYLNRTAPQGVLCDSLRIWGTCSCADGVSSPGCNASDSSTWQDPEQPDKKLAPGLFLTCIDGAGASEDKAASTSSSGSGQDSGANPRQFDEQEERSKKKLSGGSIAMIVIICVLSALVIAGVVLAAVVLRTKPQPESWLAPAVYEPVFTGVGMSSSHAAGKGRRGGGGNAGGGGAGMRFDVVSKVKDIVAKMKDVVRKARGEDYDMSALPHASPQMSQKSRLEATYGSTYLQGPALPPDPDEEMYTLEDMDDEDEVLNMGQVNHMDYYSRQYRPGAATSAAMTTSPGIGTGYYQHPQSTELEMGNVRQSKDHAGTQSLLQPGKQQQQHQLSSSHAVSGGGGGGGAAAAGSNIIQTTPVQLGPHPATPTSRVSSPRHDSAPVTPQPTGTPGLGGSHAKH